MCIFSPICVKLVNIQHKTILSMYISATHKKREEKNYFFKKMDSSKKTTVKNYQEK